MLIFILIYGLIGLLTVAIGRDIYKTSKRRPFY